MAAWHRDRESAIDNFTGEDEMKLFSIALALAVSLGAVESANAAGAEGVWLTGGGKAKVRITKCGPGLCGSVISLAQPNDPDTGKPKTDKFNADPKLRARPAVGIRVILGMKPDGENKWSGQVYNAEDGKTYSGHMTLVGANALKLEGCVLGVLCKSQDWHRVN